MPITREIALGLAETAFAQGQGRGVARMSVVVTDAGGHVRVAMRGDGQGVFGVDTAHAKAVTALGFNRATLPLTPLFTPQAVAAISGATGGRFAPLGGGVVLTDGAGEIVGALAVSGGLPEIDHDIAVASAAAHGFHTLD